MSLRLPPLPSVLACGGCGTAVDPGEPYPFRCAHAGDPRTGAGADHVLRRVLDVEALEFPAGEGHEPNPFVGFRALSHAHQLAMAGGLGDDGFIELVERLDAAVADVDGQGFRTTPLVEAPALAAVSGVSGRLFIKDETGNVAGSHKGRHLFGVLVHLEVAERLGLADPSRRRPLAIASCGNAALAAAVLAAAGRRQLLVFVPRHADPGVVARLSDLGADVTTCEREVGVAGDPSYHRLRAALDGGALPFTCQGNENGLAIEGGETLGYEIAAGVAAAGSSLDHVVVQVGGGALASAVAAAFNEAAAFGVVEHAPRLHTVQTESAWPLKRAFERVESLLEGRSGPEPVRDALGRAGRRRSEFMWPWEGASHSVAHGILDDETYDWLAVVEAMLLTGGRPVVVGEEQLEKANALARELTGIAADATGTAGLAGLVALADEGVVGRGESVALLFTGGRR